MIPAELLALMNSTVQFIRQSTSDGYGTKTYTNLAPVRCYLHYINTKVLDREGRDDTSKLTVYVAETGTGTVVQAGDRILNLEGQDFTVITAEKWIDGVSNQSWGQTVYCS